MKRFFLLLTLACLQFGCEGDDERPEVINKLRPLGVASSPLIAKPGDEVELTFHSAVPLDETVTATVEAAEVSSLFFPVTDLAMIDGSEQEVSYQNLKLHQIKARFTVPAEVADVLSGETSARMRYQVQLVSASNTVRLVGDVFVFPEGAAELAWQNPVVEIVAPTGETAGGEEVSLEGTLTKPQDEAVKIGWFTSGGEIKNRRSLKTEWDISGGAIQTLILTARGKKSKGFGIKVLDVDVK